MRKSKLNWGLAAAVTIVLSGTVGIASAAHDTVVLKDVDGNPILAADIAAGAPYSPKQTCGECHDYDAKSQGYHVQQGANEYDVAGATPNAARPFVRSPGMVGKW